MTPPGPSLLAIVRRQRTVLAVLPVVVSLAVVNWVLTPDEAWRWLRVMLTLPGLWLGMTLWHLASLASRRRRGIDDDSDVVRYFDSAVALMFVAVGLVQIVMLGLEIWVELGDHRADLDVERRVLGLAASAVFVIVGNGLPKILTPLSMLPRKQAELVTVARRFIGATFVILGLLTALAFVSASLELATSLLRWATGAGLLAILGGIVWMNLRAERQRG
jgi:hypothetical protein